MSDTHTDWHAHLCYAPGELALNSRWSALHAWVWVTWSVCCHGDEKTVICHDYGEDQEMKGEIVLSLSLVLSICHLLFHLFVPRHISVLWITVFETDSKCNAEPPQHRAATRAFSICLVHNQSSPPLILQQNSHWIQTLLWNDRQLKPFSLPLS